MYDMTDERIAKINKWMKTVATIESETKSFKVEGDPFTKWDSQYTHITKFVDGRIDRKEGKIDRSASIRLHRIDTILEDWGFKRQDYVGGHFDDKFYWHMEESVYKTFNVEINFIHRDRFKFDEYFDYIYDEKTIEEFLDERIEVFIEKNAGPVFKRDAKLRKILKTSHTQ